MWLYDEGVIDMAVDVGLDDVLRWLPVGAVVAIVALWLSRRDRANAQARQVSVASFNEWFIDDLSMLKVTVTNDSDKSLRDVQFSAWARDESEAWKQIGVYLGAERVAPKSAVFGRLGGASESRYPKGDALRLVVTFQDADYRWWVLEGKGRVKRLRRRRLKTLRAAEGAEIRAASIKR